LGAGNGSRASIIIIQRVGPGDNVRAARASRPAIVRIGGRHVQSTTCWVRGNVEDVRNGGRWPGDIFLALLRLILQVACGRELAANNRDWKIGKAAVALGLRVRKKLRQLGGIADWIRRVTDGVCGARCFPIEARWNFDRWIISSLPRGIFTRNS
jgi:hypothetical protein